MGERKYTHVQALLSEIKAMLSEGKTQREVAEHLLITHVAKPANWVIYRV